MNFDFDKSIKKEPVVISIVGNNNALFSNHTRIGRIAMVALMKAAQQICMSVPNCKLAYASVNGISLLLFTDKNKQQLMNDALNITNTVFGETIAKLAKKYYEDIPKQRDEFHGYANEIPASNICDYFIKRQNLMIHGSGCSKSMPILRHGACIKKNASNWYVDLSTPLFSHDRNYISSIVKGNAL